MADFLPRQPHLIDPSTTGVYVPAKAFIKSAEEPFWAPADTKSDNTSVELKASELAMLLAGIDLTSIKRRKRFARPA